MTSGNQRNRVEPSASRLRFPHGVLLNEVRFAIPNELFTSTTTFGAEEIAFSNWAHVHGMAVLETTHLRGFDVDFAAYHPEALRRLVRGFTTEPN